MSPTPGCGEHGVSVLARKKNEGPHGALTKESVKGAGRRTRLREASGLAALA